MANMSYCRFYNTNLDMMDCLNAFEEMFEISQAFSYAAAREDWPTLEDLDDEYGVNWTLSEVESRSAFELFERVLGFAQDMGWCDCVHYDAIQHDVDAIS